MRAGARVRGPVLRPRGGSEEVEADGTSCILSEAAGSSLRRPSWPGSSSCSSDRDDADVRSEAFDSEDVSIDGESR